MKELGFLVKMKIFRIFGRWWWNGMEFGVSPFQVFPIGNVDVIEGDLVVE